MNSTLELSLLHVNAFCIITFTHSAYSYAARTSTRHTHPIYANQIKARPTPPNKNATQSVAFSIPINPGSGLFVTPDRYLGRREVEVGDRSAAHGDEL